MDKKEKHWERKGQKEKKKKKERIEVSIYGIFTKKTQQLL